MQTTSIVWLNICEITTKWTNKLTVLCSYIIPARLPLFPVFDKLDQNIKPKNKSKENRLQILPRQQETSCYQWPQWVMPALNASSEKTISSHPYPVWCLMIILGKSTTVRVGYHAVSDSTIQICACEICLSIKLFVVCTVAQN